MQAQLTSSIGEYVPLRGYAKERGIKFVTLYKHIRVNNIPYIKLGSIALVKLSDISGYTPRQFNYRHP
jgi:hypothetical protein